MALSPSMMVEVCKRIKGGERIASFGYPDIVGDYASILNGRVPSFRPDSEAICRRHGLDAHPIPDAHSFFGILGCELDVFDIVKERGCEILIDLNEPIYGYEGYDFVLDVGTAEHCFNIGTAAQNMASFLKVGGVIIHENPFCMGNHGFYSLNPTWYTDFYEQNGFKVLACNLVLRDGRRGDVPATKRFKYTEKVEANVFAVAERIEVVDFCWPVQTKYKQLLG